MMESKSENKYIDFDKKNFPQNQEQGKERHGCVTAWLVMIIIASSIGVIIKLFQYMFGSIFEFSGEKLEGVSDWLKLILSLINVFLAIELLEWKKWAFWGFGISTIISIIIMISSYTSDEWVSTLGSITGTIIGFLILYGVLQIKKNDISSWNNLE